MMIPELPSASVALAKKIRYPLTPAVSGKVKSMARAGQR